MKFEEYRKWAITAFAICLVLSFVPTIMGYLNEPEGYQFMGLTSPLDGNTYGAFYNQAKDGNLLFTNQYTSEEVPQIMFRPVFLLMGWLGILGIPYVGAYHILRAVFIILFFMSTLKLIELSIKENKTRLYAVLLLCFSSGAGYVLRILEWAGMKRIGTTDLWLTESITFMSLLSHPHLIASLFLMSLSAWLLIRGLNEGKYWKISVAPLLLLGVIHLYDIITLYAALGLVLIYQKSSKKEKLFRKGWAYLAIPALAGFYAIYLFKFVPEFALWNSQNYLPSPPLYYLIFGYAPFIALIALWLVIDKFPKDESRQYMLMWILAGVILVYSPLNIQRRFVEGLHIPLAILSAIALAGPLQKLVRLKYLAVAIIILTIPSNIIWMDFASPDGTEINSKSPYSIPMYLDAETIEALEWTTNLPVGTVVLAPFAESNYIPRFSPAKIYAGHWAQTIDYTNRQKEVDNYYSGGNAPDADYIWNGREGETVYQNSKVEIRKT